MIGHRASRGVRFVTLGEVRRAAEVGPRGFTRGSCRQGVGHIGVHRDGRASVISRTWPASLIR